MCACVYMIGQCSALVDNVVLRCVALQQMLSRFYVGCQSTMRWHPRCAKDYLHLNE